MSRDGALIQLLYKSYCNTSSTTIRLYVIHTRNLDRYVLCYISYFYHVKIKFYLPPLYVRYFIIRFENVEHSIIPIIWKILFDNIHCHKLWKLKIKENNHEFIQLATRNDKIASGQMQKYIPHDHDFALELFSNCTCLDRMGILLSIGTIYSPSLIYQPGWQLQKLVTPTQFVKKITGTKIWFAWEIIR